MASDNYQEYAQAAIANYSQKEAASRYVLFDAVKDLPIERVLDVGCGAGQELFPFLEKTAANCFGIDVAPEIGRVTREVYKSNPDADRAFFVRSQGEKLPFADGIFDVILCRVALPYMNNRETIAEVARILKPNGVFLLKIHAPAFFLAMIGERLKTLNPKQVAYPLICLAASAWHSLTGRQLADGFWRGREIFQTRGFLKKEFAANNLRIIKELTDTNVQTPSFYIVKSEVGEKSLETGN